MPLVILHGLINRRWCGNHIEALERQRKLKLCQRWLSPTSGGSKFILCSEWVLKPHKRREMLGAHLLRGDWGLEEAFSNVSQLLSGGFKTAIEWLRSCLCLAKPCFFCYDFFIFCLFFFKLEVPTWFIFNLLARKTAFHSCHITLFYRQHFMILLM